MPYLLKVNDALIPRYLGSAKVGHIRGSLANAYTFNSHEGASWLRDTMGLKSRYNVKYIPEKVLFTERLKGN